MGFCRRLTFAPTGGTQSVEFPPAATNCTLFESQARGADVAPNTAVVQATSATAAIVLPAGLDATMTTTITFDPGGAQSANAVIVNSFAAGEPEHRAGDQGPDGHGPAGRVLPGQCDLWARHGEPGLRHRRRDPGRLVPGFELCSDGVGVPDLGVGRSGGSGADLGELQPGWHGSAAAYPAFSFPVPSPAPLAAFTNGVNGGQTRTVTVTNRYPDATSPNLITVNKRVRGDVPANAQFTVQVTCVANPGDPALPAFTPQSSCVRRRGRSHVFTVSKEYRQCYVVETAAVPARGERRQPGHPGR